MSALAELNARQCHRRGRAEPGEGPPDAHVFDLFSDALLSQLAYEERELVEPLARLGFY